MEKRIFKILDDQNEILNKLLTISAGNFSTNTDILIEKNKNTKASRTKKNTPINTLVTKTIEKNELKLIDIPCNKTSKNKKIKEWFKKNRINRVLVDAIKTKPLLVCSTQFPGYGGGATNSYNIHKFLISIGCNSVCVFFAHEKFFKKDDFVYNPEGIKNVLCFCRNKELNYDDTRAKIRKTLGIKSDSQIVLAFCKNIWAASKIPEMYPDLPIMYLVSGSHHITQHVNNNTKSCYAMLKANPDEFVKVCNIRKENEANAVAHSTYALCNSHHSNITTTLTYSTDGNIKNLFTTYFTPLIMSWKYDIDYSIYLNRPIDIMYAASTFTRNIKGKHMFENIYEGLRKHVEEKNKNITMCIIGDDVDIIHMEKSPNINLVTYTKKPNTEILKYLYNTKVLLVPSLYEACPNIMHEAMFAGASAIVSTNIGSCELMEESNLIENYFDTDEWVSKIIPRLETRAGLRDTGYMQHTVFDILNIIYEAVIKKLIEPTKCTFQNCISIDYDMLKLFGVDGCIELIGAGYKIILPEICRNAFTVHPIDKKFDNQICKTIPMLTNIIEKYPDSIVGYGRADFTKFIKMQDNYAVFSTGNSKITEHYLHGTHYTKITSLSACPHKHIVVHFSQTAPPKNLLKFVNDSFNQYESVMIMSSLNKVV